MPKEGTIKKGYHILLTDGRDVICDEVQLEGHDLDKPLARSSLIDDIKKALPEEAFEPKKEG